MAEPLSVVIITLDAERSLGPCLQSVPFADEVLVVDSGSRDATVTLAQRHGARVLHQDWLGYGPQKRFAVDQARNDWVLCIDADERVSDMLRESIEAVLASQQCSAYRMPRCNRFMGRWLRHGEGYPDRSLRLFDRRRARWSDDAVHEKVVTNVPVGTLRGDLLHESQDTIEDYLRKQNRYTTLQAEALYARGKGVGVSRVALSPLLRFLKFYVFRLGFLDGLPGFVHICIGCFNTFSKYAKLRELHAADSAD